MAAQIALAGIAGRPLRQVIALLTDGPQPLETLILASGLPRRSVESLLQAAEPDLEEHPGGLRLRPERVAAYRERLGYSQLSRSEPDDPLGRRLAASVSLLAQAEADIAAAPAGRDALDHVAATAETSVRRALWLDSRYDLAGARLLCAGDHDLTSLAACAVSPGLEVTVVDLDERILEFIDHRAAARGYRIRCLYGDFRFGLPEPAVGAADLVFTDPPFTPEGVAVFLGCGLRALRDHAAGRLVMACGYSRRQPALGLKIQRAVQDLHLVFEAVLPGFNRYHGAQAVGSASDLYVLQPTAAAWRGLASGAADRRSAGPHLPLGVLANIYTRGVHSLEGAAAPPDDTLSSELRAAASGPRRLPVTVVSSGTVARGAPEGAHAVGLPALLGSGVPAAARARPVVAAVDLTADPGPWLLRVLLAVNADRMALLVKGDHPDLVTQAAQRELTGLVSAKYELRLRRSTPDSGHAVVEADAVRGPQPAGERLARRILERAHGKAGNVWREALIQLSREESGPPLTKNDARAAIRQAVSRPDVLGLRPVDLPRHQLRALLADLTGPAGPADG